MMYRPPITIDKLTSLYNSMKSYEVITPPLTTIDNNIMLSLYEINIWIR